MKLLKMVCDELGVETDEEWLGSDGNTYKITNSGELICVEDGECQYRVDYSNLLTGKLKPVWKPKINERYYTPDIFCTDGMYYEAYIWDDDNLDTEWHRRGLAFKTKEEAKECALNMIELANHGI